jgi:hypothetical protein
MFSYGGESFRTKTELRKRIEKAIHYKERVVGREFFDAVLADLFADRHYRWKGHTPTKFAYLRNEEGDGRNWSDSLAAFIPGHGWHRFSKANLLADEVNIDTKFPKLCRERFTRVWRPKLFREGPCSVPGCPLAATDVDHVSPQHKEIVVACLRLVTDADRATWWEIIMSGDGTTHFTLPEGHPVTIEYDRLTVEGTYQMLCEHHHAKITGKRASRNLAPKKAEVFADEEVDIEALFG